jgi:hypothetical protein
MAFLKELAKMKILLIAFAIVYSLLVHVSHRGSAIGVLQCMAYFIRYFALVNYTTDFVIIKQASISF